MKLFNIQYVRLVKQCQGQFNVTLPNVALERRCTKFIRCKMFCSVYVAVECRCDHIHIVLSLYIFCLTVINNNNNKIIKMTIYKAQ